MPEYFWSDLKQCNTLGKTQEEINQNYTEHVHNVWYREEFATVWDYLAYYNRLDVEPMVVAVEHWLQQYHLFCQVEGVDILDRCVGTPGVARALMYRHAATLPGFQGLRLFPEEHKDPEEKIRDNIVGGPSIIFDDHCRVYMIWTPIEVMHLASGDELMKTE